MKVTAKSIDVAREACELMVLFCVEKEWTGAAAIEPLDRALGGALRNLEASGEFRGDRGELALVHARGAVPAERLLLAGLGARAGLDTERIRVAAAQAARRARAIRARRITFVVPDAPAGGTVARTAQAVTECALFGAHQFTEYKAPDEKRVAVEEIVVGGASAADEIAAGVRAGEVIGRATLWAKEMALHPANVLTPARLADEARSLSTLPDVTVEVHSSDWIAAMKMGGILAVNAASHNPPRFIVIDYAPASAAGRAPIAFIGKGVTFDTGGISLKDREGMGEMKADMCGAAAVIAAIRAAAELSLPVRVTGIVPAVENMPGGGAFRPGDVVRFRSGKTAEIISTDAEGRMILADALDYARELRPEFMVDLATLTGSMVMALGHVVTGFVTNDAALGERLKSAGQASGDRVWEMPLWPEYREQIRSEIADLKNSGGRPGGAITAGWFLAEFAGDAPWAHLDIAGTSNVDREISCFTKGPTGAGVRLLVEILRSWKAA